MLFLSFVLSLPVWCLAVALEGRDISSEINRHIDIDLSGKELVSTSELVITCSTCTIIGDFSISGGDEVLIDFEPDSNFSSLPWDFDSIWVGVVVEDFDVHMDFDFVLTPENATNEITVPLIPPNGITIPWKLGLLFELDWTFNPVLHGWFNSTSPANFSYGFDFKIPNNSAYLLSISDAGNVSSIRFNESKLTPLDYASTDAHDDFAFELAFRPIFEAAGTILDIIPAFTATLFADVPKVDIYVSQVDGVTRDCEPAPPGTPSAQVYYNLTHVVPSLAYDIGLNGSIIGIDAGQQVWPLGANESLPTACLAYLPGASALGPVPTPAKDSAGKSSTSGSERSLRLPRLLQLGMMNLVIAFLL